MASKHGDPIVPHVLYITDQRHPWRLPAFERLETRYHTPTTVATGFGTLDVTVKRQPGRKVITKQQTGVCCVPDDAAWERITQARAAHQQTIDDLADALRALGSYARKLAEAGGLKHAPNPLSTTVISASDPDDTDEGFYFNSWVPRVERVSAVASHTAKMFHVEKDGRPWSTTHQRNHFVCPSDDDWDRVVRLRDACRAAYDAWQKVLRDMGTYAEALADGRYRKPTTIAHLDMRGPTMTTTDPVGPSPTWPVLAAPLIYGHHRNATSGGVTHVWRPAPTPRSRQRHETLCHIVMTEPPTQPDWKHGSPRLCPDCRKAAAQLATSNEEPMSAPPVEDQQLAVVEPVAIAVPMMTEAEARACVDRIKTRLEETRQDLLELYELEGWKALGYDSWRACAVAEFGQSAATLYRQLEAAGIERDISQVEKNDAPIPTAQLRPMKDLSPDERRAAWERSAELAGDGKRTAGHVKQAVEEIRPDTKPKIPEQPADDGPKTDAGRVAAIRRYLEQQRQAGKLYQKETRDTAWDMATAIFDGPTYREMGAEIDRATTRATTPTGAPLGPGQPMPTSWPEAPEGWRWNRRGQPAHLIAPDGWMTANYNDPARALAEAERYMQGQRQGATPDLASAATARLRVLGWIVARSGEIYRLRAPTGDLYETDAAGVRAAARLLEEQGWLDPDTLMERVNALDDAAPAITVAFRHTHDRAETDLDDRLHARLAAIGYTWESAAITPDGRWHHVITSRNRALLRNDGERMRRERLVALAQIADVVAGQRTESHLPPDFAAAQQRARAIGLNLSMDLHGTFTCRNDRGSGVLYYDWPDMLRYLDNQERARAEVEAEHAQRQQASAGDDPEYQATLADALRVLVGDPDLFVRQARIMIADIDAEGCATLAGAIRVIARLVAPESDLLAAEPSPAGVRAALRRADELAGERLEDLADQLDDAEYEALAAYRRDRSVPALESEVSR